MKRVLFWYTLEKLMRIPTNLFMNLHQQLALKVMAEMRKSKEFERYEIPPQKKQT